MTSTTSLLQRAVLRRLFTSTTAIFGKRPLLLPAPAKTVQFPAEATSAACSSLFATGPKSFSKSSSSTSSSSFTGKMQDSGSKSFFYSSLMSFPSIIPSRLITTYFFYADRLKIPPKPDLALIKALGYPKYFSIRTRDGQALNAIHVHRPGAEKTVILFSGTRGGLESMLGEANWYYDRCGCNVLVVSRRGYSGSSGSTRKSLENGVFLDVEACIIYLDRLNIPRSSILAHGYSLGGAYATVAGRYFNLAAVTLDRTFTNAKSVILHLSKKYQAPTKIVTRASDSLFPVGKFMSPNLATATTDALDNQKKVSSPVFSENLYVIAGRKDDVIPEEMSHSIHQAKYGGLKCYQDRLHILDLDHYEPFYRNAADESKYLNYLSTIGFLGK